MSVPRSIARTRALTASLCVAAVTAIGLGGASAASAAKSCSTPNYPGSGYFTSLKVSGTSCATARKVTLSHYRCRVRRGGADGRCTSTLSYRCSERRTSIPTEINARVTCKRGSRTVIYTYQQNT